MSLSEGKQINKYTKINEQTHCIFSFPSLLVNERPLQQQFKVNNV